MSNDSNFEILTKSITTRNLTIPPLTELVIILATVCCPDQSEIQVKIIISDSTLSPDEIDAKIYTVAQKIYWTKASSPILSSPILVNKKPDFIEMNSEVYN